MAGGAAKTVLRAVQCPRFSCAIMKSFGATFFYDPMPFLASVNHMGSVMLSICSSSSVLYSAGSGVKRGHVVLSGLRMRIFV